MDTLYRRGFKKKHQKGVKAMNMIKCPAVATDDIIDGSLGVWSSLQDPP